MGYLDEVDKKEVCSKALSIIKACARRQLNNSLEPEEQIDNAQIAKTWADIYEMFKIKEC